MLIGQRRQTVVVRTENFVDPNFEQAAALLGWEVVERDETGLPTGIEVFVTVVPEREHYFVIRKDGVGGPQIVRFEEVPKHVEPSAIAMPLVMAVVKVLLAGLDN